ncbi:MAG: transporter substrate-binding domain-containing protein [Pseudomonadota bacterium]
MGARPIGLFLLLAALLLASQARAADSLRFVTLEFAPFIYGENKEVAGPGRDLIDAVCAEAEIRCSYDLYPWRRAQKLVKAGKADGMMVIGRNPKREEWVRFSPPHFRTEYGFFVKGTDPMAFADIDQLQGYRIGVFSPSNTATNLEAIRDQMIARGLQPLKIDAQPDDASGFRKLAAKRVDGVYSNRDRGREILEEEGLVDEVRYAGAHKGILYYAGFPKAFADQALIDRFDAAWRRLFASGAAQKIIEGYGLEPASQDP